MVQDYICYGLQFVVKYLNVTTFETIVTESSSVLVGGHMLVRRNHISSLSRFFLLFSCLIIWVLKIEGLYDSIISFVILDLDKF